MTQEATVEATKPAPDDARKAQEEAEAKARAAAREATAATLARKPAQTATAETKTADVSQQGQDGAQAPTWTPRELSAMQAWHVKPETLDPTNEAHKNFAAQLVEKQSDLGRRHSEIGRALRDMRRGAARDDGKPQTPQNPLAILGLPEDAKLEELISEETYGEQAAKVLRALVQDAAERRVESNERSLAQAQEYETGFHDKAAEIIGSLPVSDFAQIGGGVAAADLSEGDPRFDARQQIVEAAIDRVLGKFQVTGERMDVDQAIREELFSRYPEKMAAFLVKPIAKAAATRVVPTMRPSNYTALPDGDYRQRARDAAARVLASKGIR